MLPAAGNETFGVNSDPRPRHISPEKVVNLEYNAGRESLRMRIRDKIIKKNINILNHQFATDRRV